MSGLMTTHEISEFEKEIQIMNELSKLIRRPTHHFKVTHEQIIINFRNVPSEELYNLLREEGFNPSSAHARKFLRSFNEATKRTVKE